MFTFVGLKLIEGKYHITVKHSKEYKFEATNRGVSQVWELFEDLGVTKYSVSSDFFHPDEFPEIPATIFEQIAG